MAELIISVSGLRGIVGDNLTPTVATEYGCAFGTYLRRSLNKVSDKMSVCIGRDSRQSGRELMTAVAEGLCSVGINVTELGIVTTPGVGIMIRELACDGGVVITASHNPIEYNGIKLLLGNGIAPPVRVAEQIRSLYFDKDFESVDEKQTGSVSQNDSTDDIHIDKVLAIVDREKIAQKNFKVVLDSVNGAGGRVGKKMLEILGCEFVGMNNEPTGIFAHTPEPTKDNLVELCKKVVESQATVGFAQDPDADRLAVVDQAGGYIGEEYTLTLVAKHVLGKNPGLAAANLSTSRMIDDIAAQAGSEVIRTAVGEANVAEAMVKSGCVIGGEGNGGVIDLRVGPVRDSLVAMALILELMAQSGKSISQLVAETGGYCMKKQKYKAGPEETEKVILRAKEIFSEARVNNIDGCRFDFEDGWLHLRSSNTEPLMRVIVEAESEEVADGYIKKITDVIEEIPE